MTTLRIDPVPAAWPSFDAARPFRREPLFAGAAIVIAALIAPTLMAAALDPRLFQEVDIWIKPLKFQIALALYLGTLAFYANWLPEGMTRARWYRAYAGVVVFCVAAEIVWIGGAAAFGTASHFNSEIPFMERIYGVMGLFAVTLTSASLVYSIAIWRANDGRLAPSTRVALALGLVMTFGLTLIVAGTMSASGSHFVGAGVDAGGLPVLGWSRSVGDLRVAHLFATHAMHFVPAFGLIASLTLRERAARTSVLVFAAGFAALVAFVYVQALGGRPFLPGLG